MFDPGLAMMFRLGLAMMFRLGFNTNGLSHHRVGDALELCAEIGYRAVSLTPDAGLLDPFHLAASEVREVRRRAEDLGLQLTVETGSRFLLDPRRKHFPTLLEASPADRERRVDFLRRCIDLAADLGATHVSFWAGAAPGGDVGDAREGSPAADELWERLAQGIIPVLDHGRERGVRLAFEPEPGMFVERPAGYDVLCRHLGARASELGLCLDVGHLLCTADLPVSRIVHEYAERLELVHLDDVKDGVHEHLMFGEGDLDLADTLASLCAVGFQGVAAVELSRDAHRGPTAARLAFQHLQGALDANARR